MHNHQLERSFTSAVASITASATIHQISDETPPGLSLHVEATTIIPRGLDKEMKYGIAVCVV